MKFCMNSILRSWYSRFLICRSYHDVRVRFAPSPTGHLHLGGLRTALYNYLFALKHKGKFILRIEDTDQTRLVTDAFNSIVEDLNWLGISVDEGPAVGGNLGPYIQSQRLHIYSNAVQQLLDGGFAYQCFCSETRLDLLRKEAIQKRHIPRYDNKCRHTKPSDIQQKLSKGLPHCIRFKLTDFHDPVEDLVYGNVFISSSKYEGDPVIIKTDGFPTYHFANVVDDHYMKVTHVFRGIEWQTSTPKHLLLYKAFGWDPPKFGHLPLLTNTDGTKLSKRQGDISISKFREDGFFPLALSNFVISAGGGFQKEQSTKLSLETLQSLSKMFNIENLNSHPAKLNPDLLNYFNNLEIKNKLLNENETDELVKMIRNMVRLKYSERNLCLDTLHIKNILKWSAQRVSTISDLTSKKFAFLWTDGYPVHTSEITKDQKNELVSCLEKIEFSRNDINKALSWFANNTRIQFPVLMKTLRICLCGLKEGPGIAEVMEIFGKEESLRRIRFKLNSTN